MTASDWAAWVQAIGSIAAIAVAIWVPWKIHTRELSAARQARVAYRDILKGALVDLKAPLSLMSSFSTEQAELLTKQGAGAQEKRWTREQRQVAEEAAADMNASLSTMTQAASILDELETIDGVDRFDVIKSLFHLRRKLRKHLPLIQYETRMLGDYPTPPVVAVAISKLSDPIADLLQSADEALTAIETSR